MKKIFYEIGAGLLTNVLLLHYTFMKTAVGETTTELRTMSSSYANLNDINTSSPAITQTSFSSTEDGGTSDNSVKSNSNTHSQRTNADQTNFTTIAAQTLFRSVSENIGSSSEEARNSSETPEFTSPNAVTSDSTIMQAKVSTSTGTNFPLNTFDSQVTRVDSSTSTGFTVSISTPELTLALTIPSSSSIVETRDSLTTGAIDSAVTSEDQMTTADSQTSKEFPISTSVSVSASPITVHSHSSIMEKRDSLTTGAIHSAVTSEDQMTIVDPSASKEFPISTSLSVSESPITVNSHSSIMETTDSLTTGAIDSAVTSEDQMTTVDSSASKEFPISTSVSVSASPITVHSHSSIMETTDSLTTGAIDSAVTSEDQATSFNSSTSTETAICRLSLSTNERDVDCVKSFLSFQQLPNSSLSRLKIPHFGGEILVISSSINLTKKPVGNRELSFFEFLEHVEDELNKTFSDCPGFIQVIVIQIRPIRSTRFRRWIPIPMIKVSFTLELWAREAVPKWNDVRAFMKHLAVDLVSRLNINGTKLEQNDAIDTATHLYNQTAPLRLTCDWPELKGICPLCHRCLGYGAWMRCFPECDESRNEMCSVIDFQQNLTECHCRKEFVLIGGDCIHRDILMVVVFSSVGFLILLILLIILFKRKPWRKNKKYTVNYLPKTFFSRRNRQERVTMVHFQMQDQRRETKPKKWQGKLNLGFMGDSSISLEGDPEVHNYPTLTKTEASTAAFEDDRISFGSTDGAPLDQEMESYKNYSSSLDNFNLLKDGSSYGDLEDYF